MLRRNAEPTDPMVTVLESGPVRMDIDRHVVSVNGKEVQLPLKEFELLEMFLRNSGRVLTRGQLIDRVWGSDYVGDTKTLDVHVKRLRSKIEIGAGAASSPCHRSWLGVQVRGVTGGYPIPEKRSRRLVVYDLGLMISLLNRPNE